MADKIYQTMDEAVADIPDGASIMIAGFGPGTPWNLLRALYHQGARDLTLICNSGARLDSDDLVSIGTIIGAGRVRKVIASFTAATHPSRQAPLEQLLEKGLIEAELTPQGTLAERIRAGGAGIPAFFTPASVGTELAQGKEHRNFDGKTYVMEDGLTADYAFLRAWKSDSFGNLVFRRSQRNYNPIMAMAARCAIVEVEEAIVGEGELDPDEVHTSGVFVQRLIHIPPAPEGILHVSGNPSAAVARPAPDASPRHKLSRVAMAARAAAEFQDGWIVNLGIGMPTLCSDFVPEGRRVIFHSENGVIGYGRNATEEERDPHVVNAGVLPVLLQPFASIVHHADAFAVVRSGRLDVAVLGAYEAAANGDFANWKTGGRRGGGIGGAMDIAARAQRVFIIMEHTTREGAPRLLRSCGLPITAPGVVSSVFTDLGVFEPNGEGFTACELAPGYSLDEVQALTGARLTPSEGLRAASQ
jgi:3-oxoacid CoA-transferase